MLKFDKFNNEKKVVFLIQIAAVVFVLFIAFRVFRIVFGEDISLKYESEIDMVVTKVEQEKSFLTLNDSIGIYSSTPLLKEISKMGVLQSLKMLNTDSYAKFKMDFGQLVEPYRIVKEPNTDTLLVYQASDTLYFKLLTD